MKRSTIKEEQPLLRDSRGTVTFTSSNKEIGINGYQSSNGNGPDATANGDASKVVESAGTVPPEPMSMGHLALTMSMCLFLHVFSNGTFYGLSVVYVELIREFGVTRAEATLVQSIYMALVPACGILWNYPSSRLGIGPCTALGSFIGCIGLFASAFATNIAMIIFFTGVVSGLGFSICFITPFLIINSRFGKYKKMGLSLQTAGNSIGQFALTPLTDVLLREYGWNGTFLIYSAIGLNCIACGLFLHLTKQDTKTNTDQKSGKLWKPSIYKNWKIDFLFIVTVAYYFAALGESRFLVDLMELRGFGRQTGALFVSLIGIGKLVGRVIGTFSQICVTLNSSIQSFIFSFFLTLSHFMVIYMYSYWGLLAASVLNGLALGLMTAHYPLLFLAVVGAADYPAAIASANVLGGGGSFLCGVIGGIIQDGTGAYDLFFLLSIAATLFLTVSFVILAVVTRSKSGKASKNGQTFEDKNSEAARLLPNNRG